ncbi:MAG: transposase [Bryobacterales bacterium]
MPRAPRVVMEGVPYHVVQRGNDRGRIFFDELDYRRYLDFLRCYSGRHELRVLGYCLMPNHIHLVVIPNHPLALARGVGQARNLYSRWLNNRRDRVGHLWVRRYYAAPMDRSHFVAALRYVDRNPVRAKMVAAAVDFPWSSAGAHVSGVDSTGLLDMDAWREHVDAQRYWAEILESSRSDAAVDAIRAGTESGRPIGGEAFQRETARRTGRPWPPQKGGRPTKALAAAST